MVLAKNIFSIHGLRDLLVSAAARSEGNTVFGYHLADAERYGVVDFGDDGRVLEQRQGQQAGSPEEAAIKPGGIDGERCAARARICAKTDCGVNLAGLGAQSGAAILTAPGIATS